MQAAFQEVVIFYRSCSWSGKERESWDGSTEKAEDRTGNVGEPLGTLRVQREVSLVLCNAAVLSQESTRVALVTGTSCELKSFPEVKENGKSERNY